MYNTKLELKKEPLPVATTGLLVFLLGISFWFFLLQNLPFTFGDDLNVIFFANQKTWDQLVLAVLNPLTPGLYVHGTACLASTRALEPMLFRIVFELFGYNPNAFWFIKTAATALTSVLIYVLVRKTAKGTLIPLLGSLFFLTASPLYRGIAWIADLDIVAQLGMALASFFFFKLYFEKDAERDKKKFIWLILMTASYWMGMKAKETGRLFPFTALTFIVLDQNAGIFRWIKDNIALAVALLLLTLTVIPLGQSDQSILDEGARQATNHFDPANIQLVLWSNPRSAHIPSDIAHAFQWPLFIVSVASIAWAVFRKNPMIIYFLVWFTLALAGMCMGFHLVDNERYISSALVPFVCLAFSSLGYLRNKARFMHSTWAMLLLSALIAIPIQRNVGHMIYMRCFYDGINIADWKASAIIFKDLYGQAPGWKDLDAFYRNSNGQFHEIRIKEWDNTVASDRASAQKVANKWGAAYVLSFKEKLMPGLLAVSDTSNGSLFTGLMPKIKKKTLKTFYIYKVTSDQGLRATSSVMSNGLQ